MFLIVLYVSSIRWVQFYDADTVTQSALSNIPQLVQILLHNPLSPTPVDADGVTNLLSPTSPIWCRLQILSHNPLSPTPVDADSVTNLLSPISPRWCRYCHKSTQSNRPQLMQILSTIHSLQQPRADISRGRGDSGGGTRETQRLREARKLLHLHRHCLLLTRHQHHEGPAMGQESGTSSLLSESVRHEHYGQEAGTSSLLSDSVRHQHYGHTSGTSSLLSESAASSTLRAETKYVITVLRSCPSSEGTRDGTGISYVITVTQFYKWSTIIKN